MERPYGSRENAEASFGIFDNDIVLDLGCGPDPNAPETYEKREASFPRADILVDGSIDLVSFYSGKGLRFCVSDAGRLPFRDGTFDFVWCSHLLEHVNDPRTACREIVRVGTRGRIRTPSKLKELLRPNEHHHWMVSAFGNHLVFEEKSSDLFSPAWRAAVYTTPMQQWLEAISTFSNIRGKLFEIVFDWWDDFEVEVI